MERSRCELNRDGWTLRNNDLESSMALPQLYVQTSVKVNAVTHCALLKPHVACNPATGKTVYQHRNSTPGVYGDYDGATGYGMFPVKGTLFRFIDCDQSEFIAQLLAAIPRLRDTYRQDRGDHAAFGIVAAYELPNTSIHDDQGEIASVRGPGLYQIGSGSQHPSGELYTDNGSPAIQLTQDETQRLAGLFNCRIVRQMPPARKIDPVGSTGPVERWIDEYLADIQATQAGRNNTLNERAYQIGRLAHLVGRDDELMEHIYAAAVANGYVAKDGERAARATIRSGFEAGKTAPRYPFVPQNRTFVPGSQHVQKGQDPDRIPAESIERLGHGETLPNLSADSEKSAQAETAPADESLTIRTPSPVTVAAVIRLLCSRNPERALTLLPIEERSRATAYRRASRSFRRSVSIGGTESETPVSESEIRETRIRILFPQGDPVSAVIPLSELSGELFAGALDENEIEAITERIELTSNEKNAIRTRLGALHKIERIQRQLDRIPFEADRPVKNLPDLRRMVFRQVMQHLVKTDPDTGEIVPTKLSNAVQAGLLGVSVGAMAGIRSGAGVAQTAAPAQRKTFAKGERVPDKAYGRTYNPDGSVSAMVQDVSRQHVVDLPTTPRIPREKKPTGANAPVERKPRQHRRPPRQLYAAQLMRNILARFKVQASADEPLDELADKVRRAIGPDPLIDDLVNEYGAVVVSEEQS